MTRFDDLGLVERDDGPEYDVDFRERPDLYRVDRGERGVFKVEPYKSELLPLWAFKSAEAAERSADAILERFYGYLEDDDFVGADMARKYLQMGWTRARRYANRERRGHDAPGDSEKAAAAAVFKARYDEARTDERYRSRRRAHRERYG